MTKIVRSSPGARGAETRAQILDAAAPLFARVGYRKATMTDLAEAVGISKATIYLYFKNKHDVYATLIREISQRIYNRNRAAVQAEDNLEDRLHAFLVARYRNVRELLESYDVQSQFLLEDLAETQEASAGFMQKELELVEELLVQGRRDGEVADVDPHLAAVAITGTLWSLDTPWIFRREPLDVEERAADLVRLFLRGLSPRKDDE